MALAHHEVICDMCRAIFNQYTSFLEKQYIGWTSRVACRISYHAGVPELTHITEFQR